MSGISGFRITPTHVDYEARKSTPIVAAATGAGIVGDVKSVPIAKFKSDATTLAGYSQLRKEGMSKETIINVLKDLHVEHDIPEIVGKINLLETKHLKLSKDIQDLKVILTEFKIPDLTSEKREQIESRFNEITFENRESITFEDSGISVNDPETLLPFTSISIDDDKGISIVTITKDQSQMGCDQKDDKFHFDNTYSDTWTMARNYNVSKKDGEELDITGRPSGSQVAKFQSEIAKEISSEKILKPDSILRKSIANQDVIDSMDSWFSANLDSSVPSTRPIQEPTTISKISDLSKTRPPKIEGKVQPVPYKGLSEVENFLLNTPNGGMTRKMLEDINKINPIESISLTYSSDKEESYKNAFDKTKKSTTDIYDTGSSFEIRITYKADVGKYSGLALPEVHHSKGFSADDIIKSKVTPSRDIRGVSYKAKKPI